MWVELLLLLLMCSLFALCVRKTVSQINNHGVSIMVWSMIALGMVIMALAIYARIELRR